MDESQLDYLYERLLQAAPAEFPILRDVLAEHRQNLSARLWSDAESGENEERRLRAAAALATYEPLNPGWREIRDDTARSLTRVKPEFLGDWKEALRPVRAELLGPLGTIFRDRELGELQRALATSTLADYAADDVPLLADLLEDADPRQFAELFPVLARHGEAAIGALERELEMVVKPDWADAPPNPAWRDVTAEIRRAIEAAAGMVEERFVLCQTLPYPRLHGVIEPLRGCGYRPLRIRPYRVGTSVLVAAVWTRDDRSWQWLGEADADQVYARDADLRREGFLPIDVSVTVGADGSPPRYTAIWEKANVTDTEVRLIVGRLGEQEQEAPAALVEEKFNCQIANVVLDDQGQPHGASLWTRRNDQQKSTTRLFHGPAADFREDDCPGLVLTDVQLSSIELEGDGKSDSILLTTALWNVSTQVRVEGAARAVDHGATPPLAPVGRGRFSPDRDLGGAVPGWRSAGGDLGLAQAVGPRRRQGPTREAPGQRGRGALEARSRAEGVADPPASPRPEGPELSHPSTWPPGRGSEPGADSTGHTG